jgi:sodium-dependent dicarboxylate transporter 2/3/5
VDEESKGREAVPDEVSFDRWRARVGSVLAPLLFGVVWWCDFPALSPEAHRLAAIMIAVVVLWISEALPLPITALLGATGCVLLQVAKPQEVFAPFADPMMFLFIGSFILAKAILVHGVDRRLAYGVLSWRWVGGEPSRILCVYGAIALAISAWISNTATTAMMFPIGLSLVAVFCGEISPETRHRAPRYATAIMLMTTFAASIGGLATPVGTPPNLIGRSYIERQTGDQITFFGWMLVGVPVVIVMFTALYGYFHLLAARGMKPDDRVRQMLRVGRSQLGSWTSGQVSTVIAFAVTVLLWIVPGVVALVAGDKSDAYRSISGLLPESAVALGGALLLFFLPGNRRGRAMDWEQASQIEWGVVLLYGGGLSLGKLADQTGLASAVGGGMAEMIPAAGGWQLTLAAVVVAMLVSEVTSNVASATVVVPVVADFAVGIGVDPFEPMLAATMGASLGFMLPVSTPCNAIAYSSGLIPIGRMIRYGAALDVTGVVVVVLLVHWLAPWVR